MRLRNIKNPKTLEIKYRGKLSDTGISFMKDLLQMDPSKRPSAKQALRHPYFNCYKKEDAEEDYRPKRQQRVVSSTYRTGRFKINEGSSKESGYVSVERAPSYSQGRRKKHYEKGRSESRKRKDKHLMMSSTSHMGFKTDKKRSSGRKKSVKQAKRSKENLGSTNVGFKYSGGGSFRKDVEERYTADSSDKPNWKKKYGGIIDPRKAKNNFKMFRISKSFVYIVDRRRKTNFLVIYLLLKIYHLLFLVE